MRQKVRLVVTGGHVSPALALAEIAKKHSWKIFWFGEKRAIAGGAASTAEARLIPKLGIPFYQIASAKLHRTAKLQSIFSFWKIFVGFFQSLALLVIIRPNVIVSFGSYISIPPAAASWLLGIPIVLHEQTAASGLANRLVGKLATKVGVSFAQSMQDFAGKAVLTGNPLRKNIWNIAKRPKRAKSTLPTIYITGGSRGSQTINRVVVQALAKLLGKFQVYHQTGELDYQNISQVKNALLPQQAGRYHIASSFSPEEVDQILCRADLVISRAGANTVGELAAVGVPAILIPIPWSGSGEQTKNAQQLAQTGLAVVVKQDQLSAQILVRTAENMLGSPGKYKKARAKARKLVRKDAAQALFDLVVQAMHQR